MFVRIQYTPVCVPCQKHLFDISYFFLTLTMAIHCRTLEKLRLGSEIESSQGGKEVPSEERYPFTFIHSRTPIQPDISQ